LSLAAVATAIKKITFHGFGAGAEVYSGTPGAPCVFLLSPANISAKRGKMLFSETATFELSRRFRSEGAELGELFTFVSGLYFRGKLAYARAFANPPNGVAGVLAITSSRGLVLPERVVHRADLLEMSGVPIEENEVRYRDPLCRDARELAGRIGEDCRIVLLGSIASAKYVAPLVEVFGSRLLFPAEFVGRGDMSRGGLLLRCVREKVPLNYAPVVSATLRGVRPPRLPR
jgi:hypothetical protein